MLRIQNNFSLKPFNTFGMDVYASSFVKLRSDEDLLSLKNLEAYLKGVFVLGGGSNILLTTNLDTLVAYNQIKGIQTVKEDDKYVWLSVGAGEIWHDFVLFCIANQLSGVENLSLIPGTVGAAPMQNIGAYGAEVKDVIEEVRFFDFKQQQFIKVKAEDCRFDYRTSIFKQELKDKGIISSVLFRLNKYPLLKLDYGTIRTELDIQGIFEPTIKDVSNAVIQIRRSKLPDPKVIGNAGSFFKNPELKLSLFERLKEHFPNIPGYATTKDLIKVPAGWLIEHCGWKGYRLGDCGVHQNQALVLVNYGNAKGIELFQLSEEILNSVKSKFGILLQREVQII